MSKWTKEQIDEFWRQPHGHGALLAAASSFQWQCAEGAESPITSEELGRALRDADRRQRECDASRAAEYEAEMRAALPRVEGYEPSDIDDSLILTCETDPDCGVARRVVMPGQMVRVIKGARDARASQLADKCGALRTENTALLVENARLRRRIEDMERKGKR